MEPIAPQVSAAQDLDLEIGLDELPSLPSIPQASDFGLAPLSLDDSELSVGEVADFDSWNELADNSPTVGPYEPEINSALSI